MLYQLSHVRMLTEPFDRFGAWNTLYGSRADLQTGRGPPAAVGIDVRGAGRSAIVNVRGRLAQW